MVTWWDKFVKRKIPFICIQEWTARTEEDVINEHCYYACKYDIWKDRRLPMEKKPTLNHLKDTIVRLYSKRVQFITIDTHEATLFQ
jgi:hypothetical protein